MTWTAFRTRGEILRAVCEDADLRLDDSLLLDLPLDLPMDLPGVPETFRDELDLVGALQLRWYTRLSGRLDREVGQGGGGLADVVRDAWAATAEELPGLRAILDRQREVPATEEIAAALDRATEKERAMLARQAGLAGAGHGLAADRQAAVAGYRIEGDARASVRRGADAVPAPAPLAPAAELGVVDAVADPAAPDRLVTGSATFVARLKAVLAA